MPSIHPDISDRLLSFLDRRLNEHDRREVQEHLASCAACSEELGAMRAVTIALRQAGLDSRGAGGAADRYGCPGPEELCEYDPRDAADDPTGDNEWITRHLETCARCQHEVDLVHLMRRELQGATTPIAHQDLSSSVEARLMAQVRQGRGADSQPSLLDRLAPFGVSFMARAALGVGLAAAVAVWGLLHLKATPDLVAHRPFESEIRPAQPFEPSPVSPRSASPAPSVAARIEAPSRPPVAASPQPQARPGVSAEVPQASPSERRRPPPSGESPSVLARVEPPASPGPAVPSVALAPLVTGQAKGFAARPSAGPSLPPLVPAKQGESLKILVLPIRGRPGLRSRVASALQDQLEPVEPPDREFPAETSVDDLTANRRLGRLFAARYILEIGVRREASGYHIVLRAADADTGGVVAKREGSAREEKELEPVAARLAKDLRQQLQAIP